MCPPPEGGLGPMVTLAGFALSSWLATDSDSLCHPERSVRSAFPPRLLRRTDAQSKDLLFFAAERCCLGRAAMALDLHCVRTGLPKAGPSTAFGRWPHSAQDDKALWSLRSFWQSTRYSADKRCGPLHRQKPAANLSRVFRTQTQQVLWLKPQGRSISPLPGFLSENLVSNDGRKELFAHEDKVL
jgi:hypothetical protein